MDKARPYVTAALLCEKVLEEKNGSLSIIRLADRLGYQVQGMPEGSKPIVNISGLVSLKSGLVVGDHVIKVIVERPMGDRQELNSLPLKFLGKDHGQNMILNIGLAVSQDGLYWFDVVFDEEVLTRIPLMVVREDSPAPMAPKT